MLNHKAINKLITKYANIRGCMLDDEKMAIIVGDFVLFILPKNSPEVVAKLLKTEKMTPNLEFEVPLEKVETLIDKVGLHDIERTGLSIEYQKITNGNSVDILHDAEEKDIVFMNSMFMDCFPTSILKTKRKSIVLCLDDDGEVEGLICGVNIPKPEEVIYPLSFGDKIKQED